MARIRSIHPGVFSDPEFAELSDAAQVFYFGLLTEADDNGVFDWNPAKLRIRLRPGKDGGVDALLSELLAADKLRSYELDGRKFGVVRNFRKYQRPKKPKAWFVIPPEFRTYAGLSDEGSENPPQREEEGGRREEGFEPKGSPEPAADPACVAFDAWNEFARATGAPQAEFLTSSRTFTIKAVLTAVGGVEAWHRGLEKAVNAGFLRGAEGRYHGWFKLDWLLRDDHFAKLLEGEYDEARAPTGRFTPQVNTKPQTERPEDWAWRVEWHRDKGMWNPSWGPEPGQPGCFVPKELLQ